MSKRPAPFESDDDAAVVEQLLGSSPVKRARLDGSEGAAAVPKRATISKQDDDDEDDERDQLASPEPEDDRYRPTNLAANGDGEQEEGEQEEQEGGDSDSEHDDREEEAISQGVAGLRRRRGGAIAEAGVLHSVTLRNFMCHTFLEVPLDPQINFIVGHNGSGKSVVLAGIVFAFGAKASATNRASNAQGFVKKGANFAEVTLALRNKGEDAFKAEQYGKMIYITRRIQAAGGSSYKIANFEKKVVTTQRSEVAAICDHFMIQMENPVNILSQDMAKVFLHSSKPKDKYTLFLKGTQLAQLTEEYNSLWEQMQHLKAITDDKGARLKELKQKQREAQQAWKEIEQARGLEGQITLLKNELAWTQVVDIEKATEEAVKEQLDEETKLKRIVADYEVQQGIVQAMTDRVREAEEATANSDQNDDKTREDLAAIRKKQADIKNEVRGIKVEQRSMRTQIERIEATIRGYDEQIAEARKHLDGSAKEKVQRAQAALKELDEKAQSLTMQVSSARQKMSQVGDDMNKAQAEYDEARNEVTAARQSMDQADNVLQQLRSRKANSLTAFGHQVPAILAAIDRETRWREKPIGPIGRYVKLKDMTFSSLMESLLGETLNAFIVTTQEDRSRLNALIGQFRGARHTVFMTERDETFDFSSGVPDSRYRTVLSILQFENEFVQNTLINVAHIEGAILVDDRKEGDDIMRHNRASETKITACYDRHAYRIGGLDGGAKLQALHKWTQAPRLSKDVEADFQAANQRRAEEEQRVVAANQRKQALDRQLGQLHQEKRRLESEIMSCSSQLRRLVAKREELAEDAREEEAPDVRALEEAKADGQREIESIKSQFDAAEAQVQTLGNSFLPYQEQKLHLEALLAQRDEIIRSQIERVEEAVKHKLDAQHRLESRAKQREKAIERIAEKKAVVEQHGRALENAIAQANEICPRENVDLSKGKTRKRYEQQIVALEKALKTSEQRLGGNSEEIYQRWQTAKAEYEENRKMIDDLRAVREDIKKAREIRMDRWVNFRAHIAIRARMQFQYNLNLRNFSGDLKFKHEEQKLDLRVYTNNDGVKTKRNKDLSTLSGGEKSFSTICLLLSLWQAAGCPIRGLDEYDVFMDAANRRIATKLLIDAARASNGVQMILISPNSIQNFIEDAGVKVIRIADPQRNQGVLAAEDFAARQ